MNIDTGKYMAPPQGTVNCITPMPAVKETKKIVVDSTTKDKIVKSRTSDLKMN